MINNSRDPTLVIIAALNEQEGIGLTIRDIHDCLNPSICLVVDGRSNDDTVKIATDLGARVLTQEDKGKGDAIAAAIQYGRHLDVEYAALIDADYTYPAEYFPEMLDVLESNPAVGMVCGNRFGAIHESGAMRMMFGLGNRLLATTHTILNGVNLQDPLTGLRVMRWDLVKDWQPRSKGFDIEIELNCYISNMGYRIKEIPIHYRARVGEKKLKLRHGFTILRRIFGETIPSLNLPKLNLQNPETSAFTLYHKFQSNHRKNGR